MRHTTHTVCILASLALGGPALAQATRKIHLESSTPDSVVTFLTTNTGGDADVKGWPRGHKLNKIKNVNGNKVYYADFEAPPSAQPNSGSTGPIATPDERHETTLTGTAATASVAVESVTTAGGTPSLADNAETIASTVGYDTEVGFPVLIMDTNGDGVVDLRDTLYGLIDLFKLHDAIPPAFELGQIFVIANGTSPSLPWMQFSSTPFVFDPSAGFVGTPISGTATTALMLYESAAIPAPGTIGLAAIGGVIVLGRRR